MHSVQQFLWLHSNLLFSSTLFNFRGVVLLLVGCQTCDLQVSGMSPASVPLRSGLGQAAYTCVPLSPSSIIWYRRKLRS